MWLYGAFVGLALAVALEIWRQNALSDVSGESLEGVWLTAADWAIRLGFPVNVVTILFLDVISPLFARLRLDPFIILLSGIIVNWALLGALLGRLIRLITQRR